MKASQNKLLSLVLILLVQAWMSGQEIPSAMAQEKSQVCGNPALKCRTNFTFAPHELPLVIRDKIEFREYASDYFYAVILKSVKAEGVPDDCVFIPEEERLEVQRLLPQNKVFSSRASCLETQIFYDGVGQEYNFLAVYGGKTKGEAGKVLRKVRRRYQDAYIRRMSVFRTIT